MRSMRGVWFLGVVVGLGVWAVSPAGASRTYSFTSGNHAASAAFAIDGSHLVITLTNTSTE
ncbi:MAG TPA: hypothetical protein VLH79_07140, partial [Chthonomonadales bacterium]|nr:hypothetical protein [Chthonomonadales bacterium]